MSKKAEKTLKYSLDIKDIDLSNYITTIDNSGMTFNASDTYYRPTYTYRTVVVNPIEYSSPEEIKILLAIMNGLTSILEIERRSYEESKKYLMDYFHLSNPTSYGILSEIRWHLSRLRNMYFCNDSPTLWKNLSETFELYSNTYTKRILNKSNAKSLEDFCDPNSNLDLKIYECRILMRTIGEYL